MQLFYHKKNHYIEMRILIEYEKPKLIY